MNKFYAGLAISGAVLLNGLSTAQAGTDTGTMDVSASVSAVCTLASVGAMEFGAFTENTATTATDREANINLACNGRSYMLRADEGKNYTDSTRRMANGTNYISYNLYRDQARTSVWNNSNTITGTANSQKIYGRVPAGQTPTASGVYTDQVTVTLEY